MIIKSSTALRNDYGMISELAHDEAEPIYITKNGEGDLVVMSIEAFEQREETLKLRAKLEAAEEARFVVERLRGTNVSGPIAYDLEFYTADEARTDDLTGEQATQNALAFCDVIRQAGYEPVVYMNLHWAGSMYGMEALAHLPVWLASYGPVPALDRGVTLWQYSESGVVDGVEGPVDLDLWFTKE